jgi:glucose-1-phosphate adenylyltransferase
MDKPFKSCTISESALKGASSYSATFKGFIYRRQSKSELMKTIAMILAGGEGTRLTVLSEARAKPAVPFAGKFRIIDFTLSNCVNSGIYTVGVLTQYRPHSLNEHIGIGKPWDLDRGRGGVRLLQPYQGRGKGHSWYAGTADAIYQNLDFVWNNRADTVLILSGDHIYKMNYISMGIYVFSALTLEKRLSEGTEESPRSDFGKDVIPAMIAAGDRVMAYRYEGYWVDVGTVDSYWATNLDLLKPEPALDLYADQWHIHTKSEERPTAKLGPQSKVLGSMVSNGCIIRGMVVNSILSPGVYVSPGAVVKDSVIMNDTWIGPGAMLDKVVVDKEVRIGAGAVLGTGDESVANQHMPDKLFAGITVVGKGAYIPDGAKVGRNVLINSGRDTEDFPDDGVVADGQTI